MIRIPLRTVSGMNVREHFRVRAKRVKAERQAVALVLGPQKKPALPIVVTLTRIAPSSGLDPDDNLPSAFKAVRDEIAAWLNEHPDVRSWAIVDDDPGMLPSQLERFVQTDFETGLTDAAAEQVKGLLS